MPLTKGFMCKLTINLNLGSLKITTNGSSSVIPTTMHLKGSDINFPNGTCPLMISPPFTGEPGNTSPLCIQDFNIQISGENVLNQGIKYNFEIFQSQLHVVNAINGNLSKS